MLELNIEAAEFYNSVTETFTEFEGGVYHFENSLKSMSKWESIWKVPFLSEEEKTESQMISYCLCMCVEGDLSSTMINDRVLAALTKYVSDIPSATTIKHESSTKGTIMTTEVIYANMAQAGIPFEADEWNIFRLLNTLNIISVQNSPKKKMPASEVRRQNQDLNKLRRAQLHSKG